tara:strand:- start:1221 stop:1460 length:240 start_codon:yes stop_codon:yes gene_type:complete
MATISNFTDVQLTKKIQDLKKDNDSFSLDCNWDGWEYNTNVSIEKLDDSNKYKFQIWIGLTAFPYSEKGIKEAVHYINY